MSDGGPQPYAGSAKNALLEPGAAMDLSFADGLKQQVEDAMDSRQRALDTAAAGPPITPGLSQSTLRLLGQASGG